MAKKPEYWKNRMAALEDIQYRRSLEYYKDVQEQFRRAANSIQMDIERWYSRLAENNDISYAGAKRLLKRNELEEFHWTVEQYIKTGEENAVNEDWIKELENASARHHISYLETMRLQAQQHVELLTTEFEGGITDFLHKSYGEQYYRNAFEMARGTGIGTNLARIDEKSIDTIIRKPWAQDGAIFSDRIWTNKQRLVQNMHTELTQGIIRGESPQKAIDNLTKTMNVSRSQAGRLIMTESAAIASAAQKDSLKELGVEQYEVLATLDSKTSDICQKLDGKVFDMKDYEVGVTAPPFHPNCRSTTVPYFDDEFTDGEERAARDEKTGKTVYVPADMKYPDWKEKYVDKADETGIIESGAKGALTDRNDPKGERREKHAETFYQAIRNGDKKSFVKNVAKNSGMTEKSISKIYDHVFCNEHELYDGKKRFDPDYDMAESFRRLREGKNIQEHDIIMLKHERLEYELMNKTGRPYQEAHRLTESKYNYSKSLYDYKKKKGLE